MKTVPCKYLCNSDAGSCSSRYAWAASRCWAPAKRPTSPGKECCCTTPTTTGLPGNCWNTTLISTTTSQGTCTDITESVIYMQVCWLWRSLQCGDRVRGARGNEEFLLRTESYHLSLKFCSCSRHFPFCHSIKMGTWVSWLSSLRWYNRTSWGSAERGIGVYLWEVGACLFPWKQPLVKKN